MANRKYIAGRRAEYEARDILKAIGTYHTVIRAAGSKGPFDLVAIGPHGTLLVQVKRGRGISNAERIRLTRYTTELPPRYWLEVWHFKRGSRIPTVEVL